MACLVLNSPPPSVKVKNPDSPAARRLEEKDWYEMSDETPMDKKRREFLLRAVKCEEMAAQADDARLKERWSSLAATWREKVLKVASDAATNKR